MARVDVERFVRVLLSLPELALRIAWVRDWLGQRPLSHAARVLNELFEQSERSDAAAREAHLAVALALIGACDPRMVIQLRSEAAVRRLFSLERVVRHAPQPVSLAPESAVPDYGAGRELTVGERRSLARRCNRRAFEKLLADPHPLVIRLLLQNPQLTENDVVRLVARRPARNAVLQEIALAPGWLCRRRVRMSILLHPGSPLALAMPLLGVCTRGELREVVSSSESAIVLRATALELLERRPPLPPADAELQLH